MEILWKGFGKEIPQEFHVDYLILRGNHSNSMHRKLVSEAFNKAKEETGSERVTHLAQHLSDFIVEDSKEPYGERILRDNYNKLVKNVDEKIYLREHAAESLSHFLGYSNFADFIQNNLSSASTVNTNPDNFIKKNKLVLIIGVLIIAGLLIYNSATRQKWMVWEGDYYIEVEFDPEKYKVNQLKIFKEERIHFFKKVTPNCEDEFFNEDGSVKLWYGKNKNKDLEYFTALGLHPETGKTLKPITQYMIDKYICD